MADPKSVVIKLTNEQQDQIRKATGQDITEFKVEALEGRESPLSVRAMESRKAPLRVGADEARKAPLNIGTEADRKAPARIATGDNDDSADLEVQR